MPLTYLITIGELYVIAVLAISAFIVLGCVSSLLSEPKPCTPHSSFRVHNAAYLRTTQHIHTHLTRVQDGN